MKDQFIVYKADKEAGKVYTVIRGMGHQKLDVDVLKSGEAPQVTITMPGQTGLPDQMLLAITQQINSGDKKKKKVVIVEEDESESSTPAVESTQQPAAGTKTKETAKPAGEKPAETKPAETKPVEGKTKDNLP